MNSGWYTPDYSKATKLRKGANWGYKQGCAFATQKCISGTFTGQGAPSHFCTVDADTNPQICNFDRWGCFGASVVPDRVHAGPLCVRMCVRVCACVCMRVRVCACVSWRGTAW
jgi:hypothetical protein